MNQYTLRYTKNGIETDYYFSAFNEESAYILAEDHFRYLTVKHRNDIIIHLGLWDQYGDNKIERKLEDVFD